MILAMGHDHNCGLVCKITKRGVTKHLYYCVIFAIYIYTEGKNLAAGRMRPEGRRLDTTALNADLKLFPSVVNFELHAFVLLRCYAA